MDALRQRMHHRTINHIEAHTAPNQFAVAVPCEEVVTVCSEIGLIESRQSLRPFSICS